MNKIYNYNQYLKFILNEEEEVAEEAPAEETPTEEAPAEDTLGGDMGDSPETTGGVGGDSPAAEEDNKDEYLENVDYRINLIFNEIKKKIEY
jgi:hypothetical protein